MKTLLALLTVWNVILTAGVAYHATDTKHISVRLGTTLQGIVDPLFAAHREILRVHDDSIDRNEARTAILAKTTIELAALSAGFNKRLAVVEDVLEFDKDVYAPRTVLYDDTLDSLAVETVGCFVGTPESPAKGNCTNSGNCAP